MAAAGRHRLGRERGAQKRHRGREDDMSLLHLLFGFSGRINRAKFWLAVVLWIVFWAIAVPICVLAAFMILGRICPTVRCRAMSWSRDTFG